MDAGADAAGSRAYYASCVSDSDCASGVCTRGAHLEPEARCTQPCTTDADCPPARDDASRTIVLACAIAADGRRLCASACDATWNDTFHLRPGETFCVDGVLTACDQTACGCDCGPDDWCPDGLGCVPRTALGMACRRLDYECIGDRCARFVSSFACSLPLGAPCGPGMPACALCLPTPTGSFCSAWCSGDLTVPCPYGAGSLYCVGSGSSYRCLLPCVTDADCAPGWSCREYAYGAFDRIRACNDVP